MTVIAGKDAAIAILGGVAERAGGPVPVERRRINISLAVPYQLFDAADRPFVIAVGSDGQWHACANAMGLHDLAEDDSLRTNAGRVKGRERLVSGVATRAKEMRASHWIDRLQAAGVPCGFVRTVAEVLQQVDADPRTGVSPRVPGSVRFPPPKLDEHGQSIRSLGWRAFG